MAKFEMVDQRSVIVSSMIFLGILVLISAVSADRPLGRHDHLASVVDHAEKIQEDKALHFLWQTGKSSYRPVWPEIKFGWRIIVGTTIGFLGAAVGSVGGVGGGGIFVPMLTLIIGFDPKSSTAISKCMIMGAAASTVYSNLRLRHPTLDMPIIDYDLALLLQPMLMLGISFGVTFNVMFADWMVTVLLIILFTATSMKAFFKGIDTWKKESLLKQAFHEEDKLEESEAKSEEGSSGDYVPISGEPAPTAPSAGAHDNTVPILSNIYWKELFLLLFVWIAFLAVQIIKTQTVTCSLQYWTLYALQVPIAASVTLFEAVCLYKGKRVLASKGKEVTNWKVHQILFYCLCGIVAGMVGGLLGLGGGFILGPLFLELGIPPQVASATSTFSMVFSSSMSVVQYYILKRFPVPYATYFLLVATLAAFVGQHVMRKLIAMLGRASIIVFILATIIFISAITLGGVGIADMIEKLHNHEYMGFEDLCS